MRAAEEISNLIGKISTGNLHPEEPLFVLRARDIFALSLVCKWIEMVIPFHIPNDKLNEANRCASAMKKWLPRQVPGLPHTLVHGDSMHKHNTCAIKLPDGKQLRVSTGNSVATRHKPTAELVCNEVLDAINGNNNNKERSINVLLQELLKEGDLYLNGEQSHASRADTRAKFEATLQQCIALFMDKNET